MNSKRATLRIFQRIYSTSMTAITLLCKRKYTYQLLRKRISEPLRKNTTTHATTLKTDSVPSSTPHQLTLQLAVTARALSQPHFIASSYCQSSITTSLCSQQLLPELYHNLTLQLAVTARALSQYIKRIHTREKQTVSTKLAHRQQQGRQRHVFGSYREDRWGGIIMTTWEGMIGLSVVSGRSNEQFSTVNVYTVILNVA